MFDTGFPHRDLAFRNIVDLGITNVRILRKIQQLIKQIVSVTLGMHLNVIESSIATTVLLCWCAYSPDESKPKVEEIEDWNKSLISFKKEADQDSMTLAWVRRLKAYGFKHVDDLDLTIARVVERGYLEGTGFIEVAKKMDEECRKAEMTFPFANTWKRFHNSCSDDQDKFIAELHETALHAIAQIKGH